MLSRAVLRSVQNGRISARVAAGQHLLATLVRGMAKDNRPPPSRFTRPQRPHSADRSINPSSQPQQPSPLPIEPQTQGSAEPDPAYILRSQARQAYSQPPIPENTRAQDQDQPSTTQTPEPIISRDAAEASENKQTEHQIHLSSLPDLTQGIPSTLEYETAGATSRSSLATVGEADAAGAGGRGRGELPASAYISSTERRRQKLANWFFGSFILLGAGGTIYLGRDWDEEDLKRHPDVPNGWGLGLWWNRASTRLRELLTYYHEPAFEKLLPDPDPMFERPYTLCISLEDMLVHSEWSREHGWRVAKRPGVDYFLRYLSQYYELVLFTSVPFAIGEPIVRKLDPFRFIVWPLYREATKYKDGEIVKDLSYLNRDLSKVVILDTNAQHVRAQPENAIILPKWQGDASDKELVALIPFLEYICTMQYGDVRKVLKSFEDKHIPTEFARRESIARAEFNKQLQSERGRHPQQSKSGLGALGNMLGLKQNQMSMFVTAEGEQNPQEAFAQGKMLQDIARERGQRNYEILEKEIRENGEKWLKEEAELQEKAQKEAMNSMKSSFTGFFLGGKTEEKGSTPREEDKKG